MPYAEMLSNYIVPSPSGSEYGPFHISCREQENEIEREIYWQVKDEKIYGTTIASEASLFYVQRKDDHFCFIMHKTSKLQTELYVMVKRPFDATHPLLLVPFPKQGEDLDVSFKLMNKVRKSVTIPQTQDKWRSQRGLSFFIYLPARGIIGRIKKPERYVSVKKCERVIQSTESDNVTPITTSEYSTASCASPDMKDNRTLFYFTPVLIVGRDHGEGSCHHHSMVDSSAEVRDNGGTAVDGAQVNDNSGAAVGGGDGNNGGAAVDGGDGNNVDAAVGGAQVGDNCGTVYSCVAGAVGAVLTIVFAYIIHFILFSTANTKPTVVHTNLKESIKNECSGSSLDVDSASTLFIAVVTTIFTIVIVIGIKLRRWVGGHPRLPFSTEDENIKQQFIELVGEEYVFPSQAKSEITPDTET